LTRTSISEIMGNFESICRDPIFHLLVFRKIIKLLFIFRETFFCWLLLRVQVPHASSTICREFSEILELIGASQKLKKPLIIKLIMLSRQQSGTFTLPSKNHLVQLLLCLEQLLLELSNFLVFIVIRSL